MRRTKTFCAAIASLLVLASPALACTPISTAQTKKTDAFSKEFQGELILKHPGTGKYYALTEECYILDKSWRNQRPRLFINNHFDSAVPDVDVAYDMGIQILKLSRLGSNETASTRIDLYRSGTRIWYRGSKEFTQAVKRDNISLSLSDWTDQHDANTTLRKNDVELGVAYHMQPESDKKNTFSLQYWWRLDPQITTNYSLLLENRLVTFVRASGEQAAGIDFPVQFGSFDGIVIRYGSVNAPISGSVRLCASDCDELEKTRIEPLLRTRLFARLFSWFS